MAYTKGNENFPKKNIEAGVLTSFFFFRSTMLKARNEKEREREVGGDNTSTTPMDDGHSKW